MKSLQIASEEDAAQYIHNYNLLGKDSWYNRHRCANIAGFLPTHCPKKAVLDFGCGNGMFLRYLQHQGHTLSLIGYDPFMPDIDLGQEIRFYRELNDKHWGHAYSFLIIPALLIKYICYIKQALGREIHINDLPIDPLSLFSLLARLERKIIQAGRKLPMGTSVYVCARKTAR